MFQIVTEKGSHLDIRLPLLTSSLSSSCGGDSSLRSPARCSIRSLSFVFNFVRLFVCVRHVHVSWHTYICMLYYLQHTYTYKPFRMYGIRTHCCGRLQSYTFSPFLLLSQVRGRRCWLCGRGSRGKRQQHRRRRVHGRPGVVSGGCGRFGHECQTCSAWVHYPAYISPR